ncbi:MAG: tetratricopeptide repeat protein [Burkholderiaceae bacterium]|jgi:predicted negative regulator of RcsB-dependent stress response|nr:tetratricopeptide repeat protein [Burkholderiaceae bacterium]
MDKALDLEEQEQLERLRHFWNTYGTLISAVVIIAALIILGWNGWQWYQRRQAMQAAVLYDELESVVNAGQADRIKDVLASMQKNYARTIYAQQAGLIAAKGLQDKGQSDQARAALAWVANNGKDQGYRAIGRLRLASALLDAKQYDQALAQLNADMPKPFEALAADRKGDIELARGQRAQARADYLKAWKSMSQAAHTNDRCLTPQAWKDTTSALVQDYRCAIEIKLNAVGLDPASLKP